MCGLWGKGCVGLRGLNLATHVLGGAAGWAQEHAPFRVAAGGVGSGGGRVAGLDAISHLPLLAVAGADRLLRVVNYGTRCAAETALATFNSTVAEYKHVAFVPSL